MSVDASKGLSAEEKSAVAWISGPYFGGVHALLDSNRTYLNQGISWSIGILTAVVLFALTYIAPLQEIKNAPGTATRHSFSAVLQNISDADVILLTAVVSLAFAFVANFFSRSIKGYVNLIRYTGLYSCCLRVCSSPTLVTSEELNALVKDIKKYDDNFCPPLMLSVVLAKMLTELGYGLFFFILTLLYVAACVAWMHVGTCATSFWFWIVLAFGPAWLIIELFFLRCKSSYFRFNGYPIENWSEARVRK